jgi:hypothetical protein
LIGLRFGVVPEPNRNNNAPRGQRWGNKLAALHRIKKRLRANRCDEEVAVKSR